MCYRRDREGTTITSSNSAHGSGCGPVPRRDLVCGLRTSGDTCRSSCWAALAFAVRISPKRFIVKRATATRQYAEVAACRDRPENFHATYANTTGIANQVTKPPMIAPYATVQRGDHAPAENSCGDWSAMKHIVTPKHTHENPKADSSGHRNFHHEVVF